jgi:aryl-alcohol dehydrogenase-like predicted oxidoreductase
MQTRQLGRTGPTVSALGLGLMGMSDFYGPTDRAESLATIAAAREAGVTLLDTGDFYGSGHNELLLAEALRQIPREEVVIQVKFGALRDPSGGFVGFDARPASVKNFLTMTLKRLGTDYVDLYQPARLDPSVPVEDTVGAIKEMIDAGHVRHLALSEVGPDTIRRAHAVHPVASLQIEYAIVTRSLERAILPTTRELGIAINAYGVLSRGLLSGHWSRERPMQAGDFRGHSPRFSDENIDNNLSLVERLRAIAEAKGASVAAVAIAWVLAQGEDIVPLVGARRRDRLAESLTALDVALTADDLAAIERAIPRDAIAGTRYDSHSMQMLDSERAA